jgi:hypothetical protein
MAKQLKHRTELSREAQRLTGGILKEFARLDYEAPTVQAHTNMLGNKHTSGPEFVCSTVAAAIILAEVANTWLSIRKPTTVVDDADVKVIRSGKTVTITCCSLTM